MLLFAQSSLITADLRLNYFPKCLEPIAGLEGSAKFSRLKDNSSILEVPYGAYLCVKLNGATRNNVGDKSHIPTYSLVLDMQINLQNQQNKDNLVIISYEGPKIKKDASSIVVTEDGIIKTWPLNAFEKLEGGARLHSDKWHRVTITKSLEDQVLSTYIDGDDS